jgi:hypothetical protein
MTLPDDSAALVRPDHRRRAVQCTYPREVILLKAALFH